MKFSHQENFMKFYISTCSVDLLSGLGVSRVA